MSSASIIISPASPTTSISTSSNASSSSISNSKQNKPQVPITPACLRPPPNTPLSPTFATFLIPFAPTLSTAHEDVNATLNVDTTIPTTNNNKFDEEDEEPHTLTTYGDLTPTESYHPPTEAAQGPLGSPKRFAYGCLHLRSPVPKPPMHKRSYSSPSHSDSEASSSASKSATSYVGYGGYGYGGHMVGGGSAKAPWCRVVIGGDSTPTPSPTVATHSLVFPLPNKPSNQAPKPDFLVPPSTPFLSSSPLPSPTSPAPIPIPLRTLRPLSLAQSAPTPTGSHFAGRFDSFDDLEPPSPAPLPIPMPRTRPSHQFATRHSILRFNDPASDTETVVDTTDVEGRNSASDTCASESDSESDGEEDGFNKKARVMLGGLSASRPDERKKRGSASGRTIRGRKRGRADRTVEDSTRIGA